MGHQYDGLVESSGKPHDHVHDFRCCFCIQITRGQCHISTNIKRLHTDCVPLCNEPQQACCLPGFCYSPILSGTSSSVTVLSLAISFNGKNGHFLYVSYLSPSLHMKQFDRTQFLFANSAAASLFIIQCPIPPGKPTTCRECLFTFCLQIPVSLSGGQHRTVFLLLLLL